MPRVSIGLPVFNGGNYLRISLDSILRQTYTDFELLISDNASTDDTAEICREYAAKDQRIRYFRQSANIGLTKNTNFLVSQAGGQYFKWVSHDDIHAPTFVEKCVAALDADPRYVLACPRSMIIDQDGREIRIKSQRGRSQSFDQDGNTLGPMRPLDPPRTLCSDSRFIRFRDMLLYTGWCLEIYGLIRIDVLRRTALNGEFYGGDKPLLAELALHAPFVEIPETLFFYRQHPAQETLYRASARLKQLYITGSRQVRLEIPRMRLARSYWKCLQRVPLSLRDRIACSTVIAAWCLQVEKWPGLLKETAQLFGIWAEPRFRTRSAPQKVAPSPHVVEKS